MTNKENTYIVVGCKTWNKRIFDEIISQYPGKWLYYDTTKPLSDKFLKKYTPRYIFFLHWSLLVPDRITENYECVCFHMTDVPYGRGGSPLQNLITHGHDKTKLTALRMVHDLDAGPVYLKYDLYLNGSAEEVYIRATHLAAKMIKEIIINEPIPKQQSGKVVLFKRRKPNQSKISHIPSLEAVYDFIRMLDAEGYPKAFLDYKGYRFEFHRASLYDGRIASDVIITKNEETK